MHAYYEPGILTYLFLTIPISSRGQDPINTLVTKDK